MQKVILVVLGILSFVLLVACRSDKVKGAVNNVPDDAFGSTQMREVVYEHLKDVPNGVQVSIAITDTEGTNTRVYDLKRENDTLNIIEGEKYAYEIGSITKVLTSTALASAIHQEMIGLDDLVNDQYNFSFKDGIELSYKTLANHTSGLPRLPSNLSLLEVSGDNPYQMYDKKRLYQYLSEDLVLDYPSGEKSAYSNTGVALLGDALSRVFRQDYEDVIRERVFDRYRMTNSTFNRSEVKDLLVPALDGKGQPVSNWDMNVFNPTGGVISNVYDLSGFVKSHFLTDNEVLKLSRKRTHKINDHMDISLGWHMIKGKNGNNYYWHNGGTGGYSSSMVMDVENKTAIVVLSNLSALGNNTAGKADVLCFDLLKLLEQD